MVSLLTSKVTNERDQAARFTLSCRTTSGVRIRMRFPLPLRHCGVKLFGVEGAGKVFQAPGQRFPRKTPKPHASPKKCLSQLFHQFPVLFLEMAVGLAPVDLCTLETVDRRLTSDERGVQSNFRGKKPGLPGAMTHSKLFLRCDATLTF